MQAPEIRNDIDGLRAIAVLAVLFFHAQLTDFRGGFVGVDVFFVISGYLILPRVAELRRQGLFDWRDFMARRVRRLVPALVPVLIYALLAGTLLLGRGAYNDLLAQIAGAAGYVSNYVLLGQAGYFERSAEAQLLLHSWSMGVEFQFYLLAPLLLILGRAGPVLLTVGLGSFAYATWLVTAGNPLGFYAIFPRFWELGLGGLLAIWRPNLPPNLGAILRGAGLLMVLWAVHSYRADMVFPGPAALLPVLGTGLILTAPRGRRDPVLWLLESRVMQWLGTRSYSIYLWHWPLIVTVTLAAIHPTEGHYVAALLLSLPLAELSYRLIETPVRRNMWWRKPRPMAGLAGLPVLAALALWQIGGLAALRPALPLSDIRQFRDLADAARNDYARIEALNYGYHCSFDDIPSTAKMVDCLLSKPGNAPVLVIGDSHGRDFDAALRMAFPKRDIVMMHQSGCAPADYWQSEKSHCFQGLEGILTQALPELSPQAVLLASYWPAKGADALPATLELLNGQNVGIVNASPSFRTEVTGLLRQTGARAGDHGAALKIENLRSDINKINPALAEMADRSGAVLIDKLSAFCRAGLCPAYVPGSGELTWWDGQHLSPAAMAFWSTKLAQDAGLRALLQAQ